jgi:hypothetical protein
MPSRFMTRSSFILAKLIVLCLLIGLTGCHRSVRIELHSAGHPISVLVEGNHSVDTKPTGAEIRTPYGTICIERTRVKLNGLNWTAIPEDVPVRVGISKHKQWITAGPVTTKQTSR